MGEASAGPTYTVFPIFWCPTIDIGGKTLGIIHLSGQRPWWGGGGGQHLTALPSP